MDKPVTDGNDGRHHIYWDIPYPTDACVDAQRLPLDECQVWKLWTDRGTAGEWSLNSLANWEYISNLEANRFCMTISYN